MKRKKTMALVSGITVLVLLACVFIPSAAEEEGDKEKEYESVTEISVGRIQAAALMNSSGSIKLYISPEGISIDGRDTSLYNQASLKTLIYYLAHINGRTFEIDENEDYGFENPSAIFIMLLPEETVKLTLGRQNPISGEYYMKKNERKEICLIPGDTAALMLQSVNDLRDLSLFPALKEEELRGLTQIEIINKKGNITLKQLSGKKIGVFYAMTEPVETALSWEQVDRLVINPLRELHPERFVTDNPEQFAGYGFESPDIRLCLTINGKKYNCGFVQKNADTWYCRSDADPVLSELSSHQVEFLQVDFMDLIGSSIYTRSAGDVSRLSARFEDGTIDMDITGMGEELCASLGTRQLDRFELLDFWSSIDSIPAAAVLDGSEEPQAEPLLTLGICLRDGGEDILEFYPMDERQCAVYINGRSEFSTYTTVVEIVINKLSNFMGAQR